ncbi:IS30 family transposase [Arthrobacter sp. NyZ413]|uniref:IS30 family transposase n=1 Tax=Arthrobacter sp. NyZ413 TaxID=3144669 RepID=UPI003BF86889
MPSGYRAPDALKDEFFSLLRQGVSVKEASARIGVWRSNTQRWLGKTGGMRMRRGVDGGVEAGPVPAVRAGSNRLNLVDRAVIMIRVRGGARVAAIAREIGRDRSVVWREIRRNRGADGSYQADVAQILTHQRARRPKAFRLQNPELVKYVEDAMDDGWSPKLVSLVLRETFGHDESMQISHETIYQSLYVQGRGELRKDLYRCLSTSRSKRTPRGERPRGNAGQHYKDAPKISERPAEAADRAVPGHWEGDLIVGKDGRSAVGTLVERSTRYTILLHLPGRHTAQEVADAMIAQMRRLPDQLIKTVTWDRGSEMVQYPRIQMALDAGVYFCDPHSPWQRGTNENTNRLLRHWFEKGTDLSVFTADDLETIAEKLNNRPRPTLNLETPKQRMRQLIATAA